MNLPAWLWPLSLSVKLKENKLISWVKCRYLSQALIWSQQITIIPNPYLSVSCSLCRQILELVSTWIWHRVFLNEWIHGLSMSLVKCRHPGQSLKVQKTGTSRILIYEKETGRVLSPHEAVLSSESRNTCLTTPTASNMQKLKTSIGELHDSTEKQLKSGLQIWPRGFSGPRFHCWDPHHDFLGLIVFSNSSFEGFYILKPSLAPGHLWCEYRRAGTYMHVWIQSSRHIHACVIQSSRHIHAFGYGVKTSEGKRRKARKGGLRQREETQVKFSSRS